MRYALVGLLLLIAALFITNGAAVFNYIFHFPEISYPFSEVSDMGETLRYSEAYQYRYSDCIADYEGGSVEGCKKIVAWRTISHVAGAIVLILFFKALSRYVSTRLIIIFVAATITYFLFQETIHAIYLGQAMLKTVIDVFAWTIPLSFYLLWLSKHEK